MKASEPNYFVLAAGIFILIFCTLSGASIASEYSEINGAHKTNKVSVNLAEQADTQENSAFTPEDIKHLEVFSLKGADIAYYHENQSLAAYEKNQAKANVLGISGKYGMFHRIALKAGSFITPGNKNEMVAVVDEDLAMALFNNTDVVGMHIDLYGQRFRIIGVLAPDMSIVQTLAGNGYGSVYIPVEHMLAYDAGSKITSIEVKAADRGTTGKNIDDMAEALASIGKNPSDYRITDYNVEKRLVEEKALIGVFIPGVGIMLMLLQAIKKRVLEVYGIVNSTLKANYLKDALKLKAVRLGLVTSEILAALVFLGMVWNAVKFSLYISPAYIPEELIDVGFFSDLFKQLMQARVQNAGYTPSFTELKANALGMMQSWNLFIGVLAGLPLFYLGLRLLGLRQETMIKRSIYCCLFIIFSTLLSLLILAILNMPVVINTKGMLVVSAFILLSTARTK